MPRPPRSVPAVGWKVYIPIDLAVKVDLLLRDPVTDVIAFGARSAYVEALIRSDLARRGMKVDLTTELNPGTMHHSV